MEDTRKYGVNRFSQKTKKVDTMLESNSHAMLMLWALQNVTKSKKCVVFEIESGLITDQVTGTSTFPIVERDIGVARLYVERG